ncbi:MAG: family 43 glycosylhydrolase [Bacteroidales bacterium]|nr:family 43 glycosylhydrolase [Bacteroidales bacterium]
MKTRNFLTAILVAFATLGAKAQNPYLPMWEYTPDGEPYVFEDPDRPGEYRVYVYGSHDSLIKYYCGLEQVVWSAPVDDLTNWRYDGVIFRSVMGPDNRPLNHDGKGDVLYAPDVTMRVAADGRKEYFLYPNNQAWGREGMVARSERPDGPFEVCNWSADDPTRTEGVLRFDPGVFVDDDGRVYGYWGFSRSYGAELDPTTMATVRPGTEVVEDMIPGFEQDETFRFFEASSIRKVKDKYIFIYSRFTRPGEFGLGMSNYTLAYAYGDHPLGPWTYGGTIIDGRGRDVDADGNAIPTAWPHGNTHGSICKIGNQWWVFYHRQTGTDQYSRQAMVAPISVKVEKGRGGKVTISEGEYNSEGFMTEGLNPLHKSAAGLACYLTEPGTVGESFPNFFHTGSYVKPTRLGEQPEEGPYNQKIPYCPVVNNTSGSVVGYKYFNFTHTADATHPRLCVHLVPEGLDATITVMLDAPDATRGGKALGTIALVKDTPRWKKEWTIDVPNLKGVKGKHPLFFVFHSATPDKSICELHDFQFMK